MKRIIIFIIFVSFFIGSNEASSLQNIHSHHWQGLMPYYKNDSSRSYKILIHDPFIIRFNVKTNLADWVAYNLNPNKVWGFSKQQREWKRDPFLQKQSLSDKDYKGASRYGYDRGHLAPLGSFKGSALSYQHQYLTNIAPQKKDLNRGPWKRLENQIRQFVLKGKEVKVLTGLLYGQSEDMIKNYKTPPPPWNVQKMKYVPSGFWKIISTKIKGILNVCSFIMPQNASSKSSFKKYIVPLKEIKKYTGLVVFEGVKVKIKEKCSFLTKI